MVKRIIRKARINDIVRIQELINQFSRQELMLPRSLSGLYESLRDFWVCQAGRQVVGCCALQVIWHNLAEIRSLAVKKGWQNKGIGSSLIDAAVSEARQLGCKSIFALTYMPTYFKRLGFRRISKRKLPHKIWTDCINCPKFPNCKEEAIIKKL